jgi:REP-associated tyrosine transposase
MPRPLRVQLAGGLYHVTARGNNRAAIFLDDEDRAVYRGMLPTLELRRGWIFHLYCLMTNHVHLVVETPRGDISAGMQWLHGRYAEHFNERHGRTGHVFGGRFWSDLIEDDEEFETVSYYVLANPVKAGLSPTVDTWPFTGGLIVERSEPLAA